MADLYKELNPTLRYKDRKFQGTQEEFDELLDRSTTLYVGNLSFYTTEEQIHEVFSKCGEIKRIIMGLDRIHKTACGFCFVEYYWRKDAEDAVKYIAGTCVDDRLVRVDFDTGFKEGRQYGRGKSGGQIRDEVRAEFDSGRGGYGVLMARELAAAEEERRDKADNMEFSFEQAPGGGDLLDVEEFAFSQRLEPGSRKRGRRRDDNDTEPTPKKKDRIARFKDDDSDD